MNVGESTYFALVLARDLEPNLALGYVEVDRTWSFSCFDWNVLLEWKGEGEPPPVEVTL